MGIESRQALGLAAPVRAAALGVNAARKSRLPRLAKSPRPRACGVERYAGSSGYGSNSFGEGQGPERRKPGLAAGCGTEILSFDRLRRQAQDEDFHWLFIRLMLTLSEQVAPRPP